MTTGTEIYFKLLNANHSLPPFMSKKSSYTSVKLKRIKADLDLEVPLKPSKYPPERPIFYYLNVILNDEINR